jgi:hypothetical protein
MTTVIGDTDTEVFDIEELSKEIPCDSLAASTGGTCPFEESAEFHIRLFCCGTSFFLCEGCLLDLMEWQSEHTGRRAHCTLCPADYFIDKSTPAKLIGRI